MLPPLLRVLDFQTNNAVHQPVIEAIQLLRDYLDSRQIHYPTSAVPYFEAFRDEIVPIDGVVRPNLAPVVVEYNQKGEQRVNRINYEMCVLSSLRDRLRNKSIWVFGANRYRNPDEDLPADFEAKRDTYYQGLGMPLDATQEVNVMLTPRLSPTNYKKRCITPYRCLIRTYPTMTK